MTHTPQSVCYLKPTSATNSAQPFSAGRSTSDLQGLHLELVFPSVQEAAAVAEVQGPRLAGLESKGLGDEQLEVVLLAQDCEEPREIADLRLL